jgi:hypothetical protein
MATAPLQPLPGDFAVVRILGDVGRLIRVGQWLDGDGYENYEHAFIDVGDGQLVEAQPHGARLVAAARSYIGVPYSFLDYGSLALARFHVRPPVVTRYIADTHHMICSQLVDQCYVDAGVHLFTDGRFPGDVTPGNLYELIRAAQR